MNDMPTLGRSSRGRPPPIVAVVAAVLVAAGVFFALRKRRPAPPPAAPPKVEVAAVAPVAPTPTPTPSPREARAAGDDALAQSGLRRVHAVVEGPLETSIVRQVGGDVGRPLTQVMVRALVWWVSVPADLRRGDVVEALYAGEGDELHLEAVRFQSGKLGRTARAYRYQAAGDRFARFYQPDGSELELRLADAPLDDYEQVTSLLRDGRGHQGVDFKTPLGSPVKAPFDGTVARTTWNFRMNGNSVEIKESGGRHRTAIFLHLQPLPPELRAGAHVSRGQVIARSGNTGHSFAPHLHYQLMSAEGRLLDPFADAGASHRPLPADEKPAFDAVVKKLDALLDLPPAR